MKLVAIILQGKICKVGELGKLAPAPSILQKSTKGSRLSAQLFSDCRLFFVDCGFGDNPRVGPQTIFNPKKSSADNSIGVCWENRTTLPRTHKVIIPLSCLGLFFNKLTPAPGPLIASRLFWAKIKCSICSSQGNTRDSSLVEGLCVNLIFGTRGEAWIYSAHPTGALSIAVPLSVRPLSHTHLCVHNLQLNHPSMLPSTHPP